ncbi:MAG: hypothetical protein QNJ53_13805 [Pleurocapsa sp. MO_192.B19]|nr:hypothetical protein [Pleurocapsa sp. MO_192.B19]
MIINQNCSGKQIRNTIPSIKNGASAIGSATVFWAIAVILRRR